MTTGIGDGYLAFEEKNFEKWISWQIIGNIKWRENVLNSGDI